MHSLITHLNVFKVNPKEITNQVNLNAAYRATRSLPVRTMNMNNKNRYLQ